MSPQRWQQVKEVFNEALARDSAEREVYLNQVCADDPTLREEVSSLLSEERKLGSFIAAPVVAGKDADGENALLGRRIGPYKVVRELGRGGMGVVLLGERDDAQFHKQVAIKLVRHGYDVDFILNRFRYERQILASFDHPNIARLLDGGTTEDGLPYFVMEYIEGTPIDRYCDEQRLDTTARLKLFQQVCDAVHYAHRNLVVHRDIKPSNILITPAIDGKAGAPKLLDFGIAKILSPETFPETVQPTGTWDRPMTPAYASPEQVRGQTITTASDVYSLGVLLYELLTGHRPYHVAGSLPHELARVICEAEPIRPSTAITRREEVTHPSRDKITMITPEQVSAARDSQPARLRRQLQGDLDNIVLLALRKEPQRRYASVEQFAQDIQNYLEGRPVIARQDTLGYRAAKFIRRHKIGVAASALLILTLLAGIVGTLWQARAARAQQVRAEKRFNEVRKLANSLMFEFHDAILDLPGSVAARELIVKRALEYLDSLAQEASDDPSLQRELAVAYMRTGDAQGAPSFANRGDTAGSLQSYRKGLALLEAAHQAEPAHPRTRRFLAMGHERIGDVLARTSDLAGTREAYRRTHELREQLLAEQPQSTEALRDLGVSYERLGDLLMKTLDTAGAAEFMRKALANGEQLLAPKPDDHLARRDLTVSLDRMGNLLLETGEWQEALNYYRRAQQMREKLYAEAHDNSEALRDLSISGNKVGDALLKLGEVNGALASYRRSLELAEELSRKDPQDAQARGDVALGHLKLGEALAQANDLKEAAVHYQQASQAYEKLRAADPQDTLTRSNLALVYDGWGAALAAGRNFPAAAERHRQALALFAALTNEDRNDAQALRELARSHTRSGQSALLAGDAPTAQTHFREAVALLEPLATRDAPNVLTRLALAQAYAGVGESLAVSGDCTAAAQPLQQAAGLDNGLKERVARVTAHCANSGVRR